jgi:hypothetical protein
MFLHLDAMRPDPKTRGMRKSNCDNYEGLEIIKDCPEKLNQKEIDKTTNGS